MHQPYNEEETNEDPEVQSQLDEPCKVEYLDMDMFNEEDQLEKDSASLENHHSEDEEMNNSAEYTIDSPTELVKIENTQNTALDVSLRLSTCNSHETSVECDLCGQIYEHKQLLSKHLADEHDLVHPYSCEMCLEVFSNE